MTIYQSIFVDSPLGTTTHTLLRLSLLIIVPATNGRSVNDQRHYRMSSPTIGIRLFYSTISTNRRICVAAHNRIYPRYVQRSFPHKYHRICRVYMCVCGCVRTIATLPTSRNSPPHSSSLPIHTARVYSLCRIVHSQFGNVFDRVHARCGSMWCRHWTTTLSALLPYYLYIFHKCTSSGKCVAIICVRLSDRTV